MLNNHVILMFGALGGWEVALIFLVVLLLFGAKRLPEIAKALGKAINEFKKTKDNLMDYDTIESKENETDEKTSSKSAKPIKEKESSQEEESKKE